MAKITTTSAGTKFDPNSEMLSEFQRLGLKPTVQTQEFALEAEADVLNQYSGIDISEFKPGVSVYTSDEEALPILEEQRARDQGVLEQTIKGIGRIGSTILTEVLKTPGYIGGAIGSSLMDGDFIKNTVDNAWVNAFQSMDETIKESIPVYITKEVEEGNIGAKLMSSAWWATTGADGIGFLLSMYAPGQFAKALNVGKYIGQGLEGAAKFAGQTSGFSKVLTASNLLRNTAAGAKITDKAIEGINSTTAVALNTFIESSAEAANTFDNVKKTFLENNPNASEEEADQLAGQAAASVMKANIGVLALSNLADEIFLFKGFGQTAEKTAKDSILGKLFKDGKFDKEAISKLKREGIKEFGKKALPKLAANFAKEGMFEEGLQTRIQQHYEDVAAGKTEAGFWEDVVGGYVEGLFNDPEMQEAVVLGGILGGGASMVGLANEISQRNDFLFGRKNNYPSFISRVLNRKEKTESQGLIKLLDDNFVNSFRTIHDIAEKDANGKPIFDNGKIKIDESKLAEMVEQKQSVIMLNQLHNIAILEGNKAEEDMFGDQLAFNYFLPFLQQEGGYEVLTQHIDAQLVELMAKKVEDATGRTPTDAEKQGIKTKLLQRAKQFNDIFQEVHRTTNTELYVSPKDNKYGTWKQSVRDRKMQALLAYQSATKALADIKTKLVADDADLNSLSPVQLLEHAIAKKSLKEYEEFAEKAKQKYLDLSNKKGLQEDYDKYNKKIEDITTKAAEEVKKENDQVDTSISSEDFEKSITAGGYEVIRNPEMKGFYIKGERIVVENDKGRRGYVESVYDPKTKKSDQYFIDSQGKRTKITDENGQLTKAFLSSNFKPISKEQLGKERKAIAIEERKKAQLALLQELIDYRASQISSNEKEIEEIDKQIQDYNDQLTKAQKELTELFNNKISNKAKNIKKKQLKAQKELLESTIKSIEDTIANLKTRRDYLKGLIPRINALKVEYEKIKALVQAEESFSVKTELKKVEAELFTKNIEDWDLSQDEIDAINDMIDRIEKRISELEQIKRAIRNTLAANEVFIQMIKLNEEKYTQAFREFDRFFEGIPFPYAIQRIHQTVTQDIFETIGGETLAKNNIITNVIEITEWFNNNPSEILKRFGKEGPVTEEDVYNKIVEILKPYAYDILKLRSNSPLSLEDLHEMDAKVFITNKELNDLHQMMNELKDRLSVSDLYRKYIVLERLIQDKVEKRYNELRNEQAEKSLEFSQRQRGSLPEPGEETDMRDVFYKHALPSTPFSTTGISVLYEKEGPRKGSDKVDENGFPQLNDNEFQRTWFLTIDALNDEITNYVLKPVHAKYDSSDDFQKAIEANFPNEDQRSKNDIFVFLVDKTGKPVKVDKQGNLLKEGGSFVFTSIRKADEVFPAGKKPKIAPDYVLSGYLKSIGVKISLLYEKSQGRPVKELILNKADQKMAEKYMDKTMDELYADAIEWAKEEYEKFTKSLIGSNLYLEIEGTTRGYPLYQLGKDGKKKRNKPLNVFKQVKLSKERGTKQLEGATIGVTVRGPIKSKNQTITLPEGTIYLKFQNEEFVTLQSRNVNQEEARTILYLLSLADTVNPLNSITIPFPKKKDGTSYYYWFNGERVTETMPVFARRLPNGEPFSLMHTLINYGFKSEGKNKKGEIYIQKGKLHYTDFNGASHEINIKELSEAVASDKFEKYSDAVANLNQFLLQKRINVEKNLLRNNPIFMYPKLKKLGAGKYDIMFEHNKSYYEFMFDDVLTTSATTKEGYPSMLQRNVVYKATPFKIEVAASKPESNLPKKETPKGTKPAKMPSVAKDTWMAEKKQNLLKFHEVQVIGLNLNEVTAIRTFDDSLLPTLLEQAEKLKFALNENDINELRQVYLTGKIEKKEEIKEEVKASKEEIENFELPKDTTTETYEPGKGQVKVEQTKTMTAKEKLEALRAKATGQELKPKTGMAKPDDAEKRVNVTELLDDLIEQGIVQKQCK